MTRETLSALAASDPDVADIVSGFVKDNDALQIGLISKAAFVPGEYKGMVTLAPSGGGPTQVFRVEGNVTQELDRVVVAVQLFDHPRLLSLRVEIGDDLGTRIEIVDAKGHLRRNEM